MVPMYIIVDLCSSWLFLHHTRSYPRQEGGSCQALGNIGSGFEAVIDQHSRHETLI